MFSAESLSKQVSKESLEAISKSDVKVFADTSSMFKECKNISYCTTVQPFAVAIDGVQVAAPGLPVTVIV